MDLDALAKLDQPLCDAERRLLAARAEHGRLDREHDQMGFDTPEGVAFYDTKVAPLFERKIELYKHLLQIEPHGPVGCAVLMRALMDVTGGMVEGDIKEHWVAMARIRAVLERLGGEAAREPVGPRRHYGPKD